tara:strand:- start:17418 stop:17633 length:216 start_codon:yes stop_codon:yes gene_type:complete
MAQYSVICECIVSQEIVVEAKHGIEAKALAKEIFSNIMNVKNKEVCTVSATRKVFVFDVIKEERNYNDQTR